MALPKTRVTGRLPLPDDQIWLGSYVEFQLTGVDTDKASNDVVMPAALPVALNGEGRIDTTLWPNTRSEQGTSYRVTVHLMSPVTRRTSPFLLGKIVVPAVVSSASVDLTDLLAMEAPEPTVPDLLAQTLAAAARAVANADSIDDNAEKAAASALASQGSALRADGSEKAAAASAKQAADTASSVGIVIATQVDAEVGSDNGKLMTPLRSYQSFLKHYGDRLATAAQVIAGTATNLIVTPASLPAWLSSRLATRAEAEAGTDAEKLMTPLKVEQYVTKFLGTWLTGKTATAAQAAAGAATDRLMTPLATEQHMLANALGWGQTWQDMTDQRLYGTIYQNTTGRPIQVSTYGGGDFEVSPDGSVWVVVRQSQTINDGNRNFVAVIVPHNHFYRMSGSGSARSWSELR
ncbi:hypothetical protein [Falsirhodobacter sp. 20TX0035]|uniref:hypothetical protein n=1 Tax=Falsirhodobacter sp. 20TX0035 TaxID=3022019 RepID=UPI00232FDFB9|nr:hypothetical protein [Falsirhodobacter sp. 20TX0035]MDB6455034.1 hypothetical protein [Falsirhodobacter sp. 20TX0035]